MYFVYLFVGFANLFDWYLRRTRIICLIVLVWFLCRVRVLCSNYICTLCYLLTYFVQFIVYDYACLGIWSGLVCLVVGCFGFVGLVWVCCLSFKIKFGLNLVRLLFDFTFLFGLFSFSLCLFIRLFVYVQVVWVTCYLRWYDLVALTLYFFEGLLISACLVYCMV